MKKTLLILALLLFASPLFAILEPETEKYPNHLLGASFSSISGLGISYQYIFDENFRIKATGFIYYDDSDDDVSTYGVIGGEFQINLHDTRTTRFYTFAGLSVWYNDDIYKSSSGGDYSNSNVDRNFTFGLGVGFEFQVWNHIMMHIDGGFQYLRGIQSYHSNSQYYYEHSNDRSYYIGVGGGVGIGYLF